MRAWEWLKGLWKGVEGTVDPMSDPAAPNQDLPVTPPVDPDAAPNQDLPEEQPPRGPGQNRGKDEEARENAPGQQKKTPDE